MKSKKALGQKVWVYEGIHYNEGVIVSVLSDIEAYQVKTAWGTRLYIPDYVYACPEEKHLLIDQMEEDMQILNNGIHELEQLD